MAKVIQGNSLALNFYSKEEALAMLTLKIGTYEAFDQKYPGYGGFLPWMSVNQGVVGPSWDWTNRVPSLDNGQLFWAVYGLVQIL